MIGRILRELPVALLGWYEWEERAKTLLITGGDAVFEVLFGVLEEKGLNVKKMHFREIDSLQDRYQYIVLVDVLERIKEPAAFLIKLKGHLADNGKLLIGTDNRFGIRNFCGDKDRYSGHVLDGIDNYRKVSGQRMEQIGGRAYAKMELDGLLETAGIPYRQFFSVLPSLDRPQILLRYGFKPNEALDVRIFPQYKSPETVYLEEEMLYDSLLHNDMLHQMANGYLIECSLNGELTAVDQVTLQGDRERKEALATLIKKGEFVKKRALHAEAFPKLEELMEKNEYLKEHNIPVVHAYLEQGAYIMPYIEGQIATQYFRDILRKSKGIFLQEIFLWKQLIEGSSEPVPYDEVDWLKFEPGWEKRKEDDPNLHKWEMLVQNGEDSRNDIGIILKRGYIDMVSLNCFHTSVGFQFFDQEFYIENFPANAILIRTIDFIYRDCPEMEVRYPKEKLLKELNLFTHQDVWRKKGNIFLEEIRNEKQLLDYNKRYRRDSHTLQENRHRMDYTQEEYDRLFSNIFRGVENKKIYLFGSGRYAEQFMEQFGKYYKIEGILDNNSKKWGDKINGVPIISPAKIETVDMPCKVFICIKFFEEVLEQLKEMKVWDISIYDPCLDYERPMPIRTGIKTDEKKPKKYHVGYIAGVFDLFHKGHLNLFKRAKAQCDYLIVGVVSDEQVIKSKKTTPYFSFEDRCEIVEACKYVDETVKIPIERANTEDAWRMYHFDVQFSGSDYSDDPEWLARRTFLRQHGAELVFFPYTESVSSTKLKEEIREFDYKIKG